MSILLRSLLLLLLSLPGTVKLLAQAENTAVRQANLSTFLLASEVSTGFGQTNAAYTAGFDFTRVYQSRHFFNIAFEGRAQIAPSREYSEHVYLSGFKLDHRIRRVHAYGDGLIGFGSVGVTEGLSPKSRRDASTVPAFGGGLDIGLSSNWAVKADYLWQRWRLDPHEEPFHPTSTSIGVLYRWGLGGPR